MREGKFLGNDKRCKRVQYFQNKKVEKINSSWLRIATCEACRKINRIFIIQSYFYGVKIQKLHLWHFPWF